MEQVILNFDRIPDQSMFDLLNRDAALWLSATNAEVEEDLEAIANLIRLPWRMVLVESTSARLRDLLSDQQAEDGALTAFRGFVHVVASDPSKIPLPRRALPVFFLNGVENAKENEERSSLSSLAASRRRLNVYKELALASPSRLVVAGHRTTEIIEIVSELWDADFRSRVDVITANLEELEQARDIFKRLGGLSVATLVSQPFLEMAHEIWDRAKALLPSASIRIRVTTDDKQVEELDISQAELPEHPVLDRYRLIKSEDLVRVTPEDLTIDDISGFFDKSIQSWRPFAAGLPWIPDRSAITELIADMRAVRRKGPEANALRYIWSDPGAGGTTLARTLGFEVAQTGYPVLVAEDSLGLPNALELASFLYRVYQTENATSQGHSTNHAFKTETPWLLIFEEHHWEGHETELNSFLAELRTSGRPVLVLLILQNYLHPDIESVKGAKCIAELRHEISKNEAIDLGRHLNRYLKHLGKAKEEAEWSSFWQKHKPDNNADIASFWVALEFWLRGLIDLGESIQGWLWRKFKDAQLSPDLNRIVLQIAAYTIQRKALPEALIRRPSGETLPLSVILENIKYSVPALSLIGSRSDNGRTWSLAHDILGRYLMTSAFYDRNFLRSLELDDIGSQIELRLRMISEPARHPAIGEQSFHPFAVELAVNVLKLDADGNHEFFPYWREILGVLDQVPQTVQRSSRAFNHHVAISRRRVATNAEFDADESEKKFQLNRAIQQLEFALRKLDELSSDEADLNLLNTLALTYQNLAELSIQTGDPLEHIAGLRQKASEVTREALARDPSNRFVLETAAKNLLQRGRVEKTESVVAAAEALSYVFQAAALDGSAYRQTQLARLTKGALDLLLAPDSDEAIDRLCTQGQPYGFLARAWKIITKNLNEGAPLESAPIEDAIAALEALEAAPQKNWLLLRLQYDLVVLVSKTDFEAQLTVLDELAGTDYRMPPQIRLEQAILLHQTGRHEEANQKFSRLRIDLKQRAVTVAVPERLRWLLSPDRQTRQTCQAEVLDDVGFRAMAKVRTLKDAKVPFVAQDFGVRQFAPGSRFKCFITFGSMGPFIRPTVHTE
ncbi:MAG: hypothetical protein ACRYF7_08635 [Janthinobacterium lividum]